MTPTLPQPPFELPPATRDETAPRGGPIRVQSEGRGKQLRMADETKRRENSTAYRHALGNKIDVNVLPLDRLFR